MRITKCSMSVHSDGKCFMTEHYENVKGVSDFERRVIDIMFIHGCDVEICYDKVEKTVILKYEVKHNG